MKEEKNSDDEEGEQKSDRPCPLKAAGLLGRKGKALKDAAASSGEGQVKVEKKEEDIDLSSEPPVAAADTSPSKKKKVKTEPSSASNGDEIDYAAALDTARSLTSSELFKLIQTSRSTRAKNPSNPASNPPVSPSNSSTPPTWPPNSANVSFPSSKPT